MSYDPASLGTIVGWAILIIGVVVVTLGLQGIDDSNAGPPK